MIFEFLRKIDLFSDLPEPDLLYLCETIQEVELEAGELLFSEGDAGDQAYVIKEGELEIVKKSGERDVLLSVRKPGEVIGEIALLESQPRMASVRARKDSVLYTIRKEQLDYLLSNSLSAANAIFRTILARWRNTQTMLRQSEKMAELGTLTAGVAHELNNPAAAVKRGAAQLQSAIERYAAAQSDLTTLVCTPDQWEVLRKLEDKVREQAKLPSLLDSLTRSDLESELEDWLESEGIPNAWELAPALVELNIHDQELEALTAQFTAPQMPQVLTWLNTTYSVYNLLAEIGQGAERISEIVKALKTYAYLDQAPVQNVNIHEGIDNTFMILRNKLKGGIEVKREYAPDVPEIFGYGSELNQVWTNLLDNAIDALDDQGEITVRTRREDKWVIVEIVDNGPGIPEDIQKRIFDPFFTTKPIGKGTGLGLDISYNIVVHKHRGDIRVSSQPGETCFQVWLPVNFQEH